MPKRAHKWPLFLFHEKYSLFYFFLYFPHEFRLSRLLKTPIYSVVFVESSQLPYQITLHKK